MLIEITEEVAEEIVEKVDTDQGIGVSWVGLFELFFNLSKISGLNQACAGLY